MLKSRDLDEPIGPQIGIDPRNSWFFVFLRRLDYPSGSGSILDRDVKLAFDRLKGVYRDQTNILYFSPSSVNFDRNRLRFRLQRLPAVAVAQNDVLSIEEPPERPNILEQLWGIIRGKKSAYPTLDRDALKLIAKEQDGDTTALEYFLSDVHLKLVDEGIAAVDREFLVAQIQKHAKVAGKVVKETVRVVKWP